jgi:hypothetical protein
MSKSVHSFHRFSSFHSTALAKWPPHFIPIGRAVRLSDIIPRKDRLATIDRGGNPDAHANQDNAAARLK